MQLEPLVFRDVEVRGVRCDVEVTGGRVTAIASRIDGRRTIPGDGGALIPGLHEHHTHLFAQAAARTSVDVSNGLAHLAHARPSSGWVRAVKFDGNADRLALDRVRPDVSVRVQHRGGSLWMLNTAAVAELGLDSGACAGVDGIERDAAGHATGRLWRMDRWLTGRVPTVTADVAEVARDLAGYGVTAITDATPDLAPAAQDALMNLPQSVTLMAATANGPTADARKIVLSDHELPSLGHLRDTVTTEHAAGRCVAVHAVTRAAILLALAVFDDVGSRQGDRIEHAAVVPPEAVEGLLRHRLTVVTQPSLVQSRGDDYLARCDPDDVPYLWPYGTLLRAGVKVVASSDAPYGDPNPWVGIRCARDRVTRSGRLMGPDERVSAQDCLDGYLTTVKGSSHRVRRLEVGSPADLVLLHAPLSTVLEELPDTPVVRTMIGGVVVSTAT